MWFEGNKEFGRYSRRVWLVSRELSERDRQRLCSKYCGSCVANLKRNCSLVKCGIQRSARIRNGIHAKTTRARSGIYPRSGMAT